MKNLHSRQSLSGVPHQEFLDQVLGLGRNVLPFVVGKVIDPVLDPCEETVLTVLAGLSSLPATVLPTLTIKGRISTKHDIPANPRRRNHIKSLFSLTFLCMSFKNK